MSCMTFEGEKMFRAEFFINLCTNVGKFLKNTKYVRLSYVT